MISHELTKNETEIFWHYPPTAFRFVREMPFPTSRMKTPIGCAQTDGRFMVGYAINSENVCDVRRGFYVMADDLKSDADVPSEAVDPLTVSPGVPGLKTERRLTPEQAAQLASIQAEREAKAEQRRRLARDRQRKCRARTTKRRRV